MTCAPSLQPECAAGGLALHGPAQDLAATALSVPLTLVVALLGLLESAVGLPQRALILLHAAWIAVLAVTSLGAPCPPTRAPDSPDQ